MADSELETALEHARRLALREEYGHRAVSRVLANRVARPRRWPLWAAVAAIAWGAVATAAGIALWVGSKRPAAEAPTKVERRGTVVQVGRRVVLNVHEGGRFHVYRADDSSSIIEVTGGEVGFRLFHGVAAHRLLVSAGGMTVEAVGTVFTVGLDGGPSVAVHQGKVAARVGEEEFLVTQGFELHAASGRLLANSEQDPILESWDLTIESQSREPSAAASSAVKTGRTPDAATARTKIESEPDERSESASGLADAGRRLAVDLWRSARLLRAQARYLEAISALEELASMEDSTWSPLALVEKARIERSALSDPKAALRSAGEFMRRHPSHQLAPEARQLRCDAARAVGITEQDCL